MPWTIKQGAGCGGSRPWAVVKDSDGTVEGCHPTRGAAERQRKALYASENGPTRAVDIDTLNNVTRQAVLALHGNEEHLSAIYQTAMNRLGEHAATRFRREALNAAGFVEPYIDEEFATLHPSMEAAIEREQHEMALTVWEMLMGLVPLAFFTSLFLDSLNQRVKAAMEDAVRDEIRAIVQQGVDEGASATATAARIRERFSDISGVTARMLAATQTTTIVNEASLRAAEELQKRRRRQVYKTWNTMGDARVRLAHAQTAGQTVPLNAPFDVGGYAMMYPGDMSAPLKLTANCRCHLSYTEALTASASSSTLTPGRYREMSEFGEATIRVKPVLDWSDLEIAWPTATTTTTNTTEVASTITISTDEREPGEVEDETEESLSWRGIITLEGTSTGDGRHFVADAWTWRELPLSLLAQTKTADGHDGAEVAGRIDRIWKIPAAEAGLEGLGEDAVAVMGEGVFDSSEFGREIARMVREQMLRGISVDFGVSEAALYDTETGQIVSPDEITDPGEMLFSQRYERAAIKAEIGAATVVAHPAFANASIALTASGSAHVYATQLWIVDEDVLTASGAGLALERPPRDWFADPRLESPSALQITPEGRIFGHMALWGTCHTGLPGCEQPPHSNTDYRYFHLGAIPVDDGGLVPCGVLTMNTGHAGVSLPWQTAKSHYDNTGMVAAHVVAGEDIHGIWIAGAINPDLDATKLRLLHGATPSGDWRTIDGHYREMMGVVAVNLPGFPVPRPEAHVALTASGDSEVVALIAAGIPEYVETVELSKAEQRQIRALTDTIYGSASDSIE